MATSWAALCLPVLLFVLSAHSQTCPAINSQQCSICYYGGAATLEPTQVDPNKYFVIGGLFDIHSRGDSAYSCGSTISEDALVNSLAFFWAIQQTSVQINAGVSVGAVAFDTCGRTDQSIETVLGYAQCKINIQKMQHANLVAYIGPYGNEDTLRTGMLASDLGITLLSPSANSPDLNSNDQSSLLRLRPSFEYDLLAIDALLKNINPSYVMVLYSESDPFWMDVYQRLKQMLSQRGQQLCIQFETNIDQYMNNPTSLTNFVSGELKDRLKAKYVIPLMSKSSLSTLLDAVAQNQDVNGNLRFIFTSDLGRDRAFLISKNAAAKDAIIIDNFNPAVTSASTTTYGNYDGEMNRFKSYINSLNSSVALSGVNNPWLSEFISSGRRLPVMDSNTRSSLMASVMRTIKAVELIIKGMDTAMNNCNRISGVNNYQFCDQYRNQRDKQNQLYSIIKSAETIFSGSGELTSSNVFYKYYVYNNQQFSLIGTFDGAAAAWNDPNWYNNAMYGPAFTGSECPQAGTCCEPDTTVAPPTTQPPSVTTPQGAATSPAAPRYSMVKYRLGQAITGAFPAASEQDVQRDEWGTRFDLGHRWVIALGVLAGLGILSVVIFEIYILYKLLGTRMGHKWRTMWLGQLLLFGIFLAYLVLFAFIFIPTKATCGITRFGVGFSYAVCFSVLLVKLMVILTSKTSSEVLLPGDESPNYLKGIYQFLMFVFAVGVQIVIDVQWLITVPPEAVQVTSNSGSQVWVCNHYTWDADKGMDSMGDFVRTNFENHLMSLIYIMVMILITTLLSLNAHGIITNHRESVFIGIAAGFSIPIWLAWGLVGGLNRDHAQAQEFGDACIAFGLFLTVTLIMFSMFLPKVRQLVNMGVEGIYLEDDRDTYYAGSVIMAPPSYKSKGPGSVIYVNNQGIYSEPVIVGNGEANSTHLKHPLSTYSAPINPTYLKKAESAYGSTRILRVTDDLSGRGRHAGKKGAQSEVAYGSQGRPRSARGVLQRSRSQTSLGAL